MDKIAAFINETDRGEIIAAVKDAEKRTSGEIVPMVVSASSPYPAATFLASLALALGAGIIITFLIMQSDWAAERVYRIFDSPLNRRLAALWVFLLSFLPSIALGKALAGAAPGIMKVFLPRGEMAEQVEETAFLEFQRHGLDKTRGRNGVLIYISIFERQVKIIADRGINDKVSPGEWSEIADTLAAGIKKGGNAAAICGAVRQCGDLLAKHFPFKPGDRDELENLVVEK